MGWQLIGHGWAVALLRRSLAANRVAHAYLFSGPPHIGKTKLALELPEHDLHCKPKLGSNKEHLTAVYVYPYGYSNDGDP